MFAYISHGRENAGCCGGMSSPRVKEVRFVFVSIEKIKKMINELEF